MFMREVEDVVREIMEDSRFNGHQHYKFEAEFDENGELLFGGEASAGVSFQIGQIRYILCIYQINKVYILYILCILQLFFTCFLRPVGGRRPKREMDTYGPDDIRVDLMFFSTFEDLDLPGSGPMESK